jgi:hypothetical protein
LNSYLYITSPLGRCPVFGVHYTPPVKDPRELPPPQNNLPAILSALAGITGLDPRLKSHAVRLDRVSRELTQAGYTPENVKAFMSYWRSHDWRWKKDQQRPTPEDVLEQIARSRISPGKELAASWAEALAGSYGN